MVGGGGACTRPRRALPSFQVEIISTLTLAWVYPYCLARSKFRSARQSGGYGLFLSQEFAKM